MTKGHYISFIAFATGDKIQIIKQYPEWNIQTRISKRGHDMLLGIAQSMDYSINLYRKYYICINGTAKLSPPTSRGMLPSQRVP